MNRRTGLFAAAAAALLFALPAAAQQYPSRQITIVVPFPAGGQQDVEARGLAQSMEPRLKQAIIVENRTAAGSAIGIGHVAKAAPDGYTVLITGAGAALLKLVSKNLDFDPTKDIVPVSMLTDTTSLIVAPAELGARNWNEFMALARKSPGKLNYASLGVSSVLLAVEGLKSAAGNLPLSEIPYKGFSEYLTATLRNDVQLMIGTYGPMKAHVDSGKLVALLAIGDRRHPATPNVPSTGELGYGKGIRSFAWTGMFVPAGTPQNIIDTLQREVAFYVQTPGAKERAEKATNILVGSTPAEFKKVYDADIAAWGAVAKAINLQPQ
jgi:tripartite-type tricarboxylate transporter receptor subunit TctC